MTSSRFSRHVLTACAAAALLAGCGGSQPPMGALGAMMQSHRTAQQVARGKAWMLSGAKSSTLLYVGDNAGHVFLFSYPKGTLQGTLNVIANAMCSDKSGNVFMTQIVGSGSRIVEYAHGGTKQINALGDPGYAMGCAVDPVSGNLAVANFSSGSNAGSLLVYPGAQGKPIAYSNAAFYTYSYCGYDEDGNLYVDGFGGGPSYKFQFAELASGAETLSAISLSDSAASGSPGSVQWDGRYIALGIYGAKHIYRLAISGSVAEVVGIMKLRGVKEPAYAFWIQGSTLITATGVHPTSIGYWTYPHSGKAFKSIKGFLQDRANLRSFAISASPELPGVCNADFES